MRINHRRNVVPVPGHRISDDEAALLGLYRGFDAYDRTDYGYDVAHTEVQETRPLLTPHQVHQLRQRRASS